MYKNKIDEIEKEGQKLAEEIITNFKRWFPLIDTLGVINYLGPLLAEFGQKCYQKGQETKK